MKAAAFLLALALVVPAVAHAQGDEPPGRRPIGRFAADVRAAFPTFDQDEVTAERLGVTTANLPGRGYGVVLGAHAYPVRMRLATLGVGGEMMTSRGTRSLEPTEEGGPESVGVRTRFASLSPQVSLNFGGRDGWSYISAGLGWARYSVERQDGAPPATDPPRRRTLNYGGGARWFLSGHVAFSIDLRFYSVDAQAATDPHPDMPSMRRVVMSAGLAFK